MLPQEIIDSVFLNLDISQLRKTRNLQSNYVKSCTKYEFTSTAAKHGKLRNISWLRKRGVPWHPDTLTKAVKKGRIDTIRFLLKNDVDIPQQRLEDLFLKCIQKNLLEVIQYVKRKKPDYKCPRFVTTFCIDYDRLEILKELYVDNWDIGYSMDNAISHERKSILDFLLSKKPDLVDRCFESSIVKNKLNILQHLIEKKSFDKEVYFKKALKCNSLNVVSFLHKYWGITKKYSYRDIHGDISLKYYKDLLKVDLVKYLLDNDLLR